MSAPARWPGGGLLQRSFSVGLTAINIGWVGWLGNSIYPFEFLQVKSGHGRAVDQQHIIVVGCISTAGEGERAGHDDSVVNNDHLVMHSILIAVYLDRQ